MTNPSQSASGAAAPGSTALRRPDYRLTDNLWARDGQVFMTGTQALVRLPLMQRWRDEAAGLDTRGFVSGYRGSPLGMVDQQIWKAGPKWKEAGLEFVPAVNEELAATQVLGTQRVESDAQKTCDAVFAMWYGKGPGVDRAGDAIKHGNAYGSSPHGGVLVVAGDDHGCVSSSMPHQSDPLFQAYHMPVVAPATVAEHLEFGLYGWQLSRFSGNWVGLTSLSEVVECGATVDLDAVNARVAGWRTNDEVAARTAHLPPAQGLHYRWPDFPSLQIEERLAAKMRAVAAFSAVNSIDRHVIESPRATVGIVTCGKAHYDLMEVLRRLQITPAKLADAGVRLYKIGLAFPIETTRALAFAQGLQEILVIEEKGPVVENQLRELFYNAPGGLRPVILGKKDAQGAPLVSALGELRPSRLIELTADWLIGHFPGLFADRRAHVSDFTLPDLLSNDADSVRRMPYFCAGCPHNTSTVVPDGSTARAGIGCHFMANWMNRDTAGLIQMGGEGVDWVSHSRFTELPHVFQNLGDGTYYHSGYLAIRQAVAAKARITYKILFNDAVAMTGGQPVDGVISVDAIARQVESEGVKQVVVLSDDIGKYEGIKGQFPADTRFFDRAELDRVQRELREVDGVTVLIYEQTCAAEKRRRRKKGELKDPDKRLFIHDAVCEGCGDCSVQSNCVAVLPLETPLGRKRKIDQTACNKDYSCAKGFCPSFVGVRGGKLRKKSGALSGVEGQGAFQRLVDGLPLPAPHAWTGPYDLLVTGVGGTGVVTVGAVIAMAAHLEGKSASVLDFMGFAQKGGAVMSFVRLADVPERLNQVRIDTQQADAILACDTVVAAQPEPLAAVRHGRTRILANVHETPVAESLQNPDASLKTELLLAKLRFAAGDERVETFDAQRLAEDFLGDTVTANVLAMGYAWQRGLVPVGLAAMERAIELNGVAVAANQAAFSLGRLAAHDPGACAALLGVQAFAADEPDSLDALMARDMSHLTAYQNDAWAQRYAALVREVHAREQAVVPGSERLTRAVAHSLRKLMSYKDEYEVARLYTEPSFRQALQQQFEGDVRLSFYMAPPLLARGGDGAPPRKIEFGSWMLPAMRWLAKAKSLRGSVFDVFGKTEERRMERALITRYEERVRELLPQLTAENLKLATEIAAVPMTMRGFGHVKQANVVLARVREAELLHRFDAGRYPAPASSAKAGQLKGISVVAAN